MEYSVLNMGPLSYSFFKSMEMIAGKRLERVKNAVSSGHSIAPAHELTMVVIAWTPPVQTQVRKQKSMSEGGEVGTSADSYP